MLRTLFWAATIVHWRIPHFYLMHRALHPWRTENDTSGSLSQSDPNGLRIEAINLWIIIDGRKEQEGFTLIYTFKTRMRRNQVGALANTSEARTDKISGLGILISTISLVCFSTKPNGFGRSTFWMSCTEDLCTICVLYVKAWKFASLHTGSNLASKRVFYVFCMYI